MHRTRSPRLAAALAGGLLALAACGGDDPTPAGGSDPTTASGSTGSSDGGPSDTAGAVGGAPAADPELACSLLTADQILTAIGLFVDAGEVGDSSAGSTCTYAGSDPLLGQSANLQVIVGKADTDWEFTRDSFVEDGGEPVAAGDDAVLKYDDSNAPLAIAQLAMKVGDDVVVLTLGAFADQLPEADAALAAADLGTQIAEALGAG